ncbi:hypothetical protein BCR34DRAFT_627373 [Clohesyomyces aquaticus]|uniref:Uncharacterized protein n=1 Tax=Clohesyomyces aquaticus TaxID=1231657 RepID=A0A1Y1YZZ1_9PLEO|nr:hypothetical protein BCR34DRAFT_627373 [Clohesyomyces aquaticus]
MPALPLTGGVAASQMNNLVARAAQLSSGLGRAVEDAAIARRAPGEGMLQERQSGSGGIIPTYYNTNGPSPATVVGIVLGSVAGFFLIIWLLYSLTYMSRGAAITGEEEIVVRRRRGSRSPHSRRSRRSTRTEVREYSRSPRRSHIVVEERRGPPPPRTRSIIVEERVRVPNDDVVEVIEEHDEYRARRGGRRSGQYR